MKTRWRVGTETRTSAAPSLTPTCGEANKIFTGAIVAMNGLVIHPYARVYNTLGAAAGLQRGGGNVNGSRTLVLGAQALALVDLGVPGWEQENEDYNNRYGVSINKMGRLVEATVPYDGGSVEDFGVMAIDSRDLIFPSPTGTSLRNSDERAEYRRRAVPTRVFSYTAPTRCPALPCRRSRGKKSAFD